jgi:hypothetical protein
LETTVFSEFLTCIILPWRIYRIRQRNGAKRNKLRYIRGKRKGLRKGKANSCNRYTNV